MESQTDNFRKIEIFSKCSRPDIFWLVYRLIVLTLKGPKPYKIAPLS